jgi:hypothetical protein
MKDLDNLTMDELHGILTTYEIRTMWENPQSMRKHSKIKKNKLKRTPNV